MRPIAAAALLLSSLVLLACSDDDAGGDTGTTAGGAGGAAGAGPGGGGTSAGVSGSSGQSGAAGSAGGQGGTAGQGSAGQAGVGGGAVAGAGGSGGASGGPSGGGAGGGAGSEAGGAGGAAGAGQGGSDAGAAGDGPGQCGTEAECAPFKTPAGQGQPPAPSGGGAAEGPASVQAFSEFFLGETDRQGGLSPDAWKAYGFDLDGWSSTVNQGFHCKAQPGAKNSDIREDGPGGVDNSFGRNFIPLLTSINDGVSSQATAALQEGAMSFLLDVGALGAASSYASLAGTYRAARGVQQDGVPVAPPAGDWSGYAWSPYTAPTAAFSEAYLTGDVLVARFAQPLPLAFSLSGQVMSLTVRNARLQVDLADRANGVNGTLGGVVDAEELVESLRQIAATLDLSFCEPGNATFASIAAQIRASSDILLDGTQDPTRLCDGISIGIGFSTKASSKGAAVAAEPVPDVCAE